MDKSASSPYIGKSMFLWRYAVNPESVFMNRYLPQNMGVPKNVYLDNWTLISIMNMAMGMW